MKQFRVNKETLSGMMTTGEIYSDGECLDYVLDVIQQLERDYHEIHS